MPLAVPASPTLQELQAEVRELLRAGAVFPLPSVVRRLQHRVLSRVDEELGGAGRPRLYVLEIAGAVPRVKIGISSNPRARVRQHVTEMTRYQHGLVDAYVTDPLAGPVAADRAEGQAHRWMRKIFAPITREEFAHGDFAFAVVCADQAVRIQDEADAR